MRGLLRRRRGASMYEAAIDGKDWKVSLEHVALVWDDRYAMLLERVANLEANVKFLQEFVVNDARSGD